MENNKAYQIEDAQMDILRMLNHATDCDFSKMTPSDICAIGTLAKAVKDLEKALYHANMEHAEGDDAAALKK